MKERKFPGKWYKYADGYRQDDGNAFNFVPACAVSKFDEKTGELWEIPAPAARPKRHAVQATTEGEYIYSAESEEAPTGCDFSASLAFYGNHYFLHPLRDDLPQLHGRGIKYDPARNSYMVTINAYDRLLSSYRISRKTCD